MSIRSALAWMVRRPSCGLSVTLILTLAVVAADAAASTTRPAREKVVELVPVDVDAEPGKRVTVNLGPLSRSPNAVTAVDADQDGFTDLLVFTPEKPMIMLRSEGKVAAEPAPAPSRGRPDEVILYTTRSGELWHTRRECRHLLCATAVLDRKPCLTCAEADLAETPVGPQR